MLQVELCFLAVLTQQRTRPGDNDVLPGGLVCQGVGCFVSLCFLLLWQLLHPSLRRQRLQYLMMVNEPDNDTDEQDVSKVENV